MIYSRALRNMEVQRARHNKLFIFSKGCRLPNSMIRILKLCRAKIHMGAIIECGGSFAGGFRLGTEVFGGCG
jgi:hypothetical protein